MDMRRDDVYGMTCDASSSVGYRARAAKTTEYAPVAPTIQDLYHSASSSLPTSTGMHCNCHRASFADQVTVLTAVECPD